jgi:ATP-binding cassette, subfamily B, multidrug efflux pump
VKELLYLNKYFYKYRWRLLLGIIFVIVSNYFRVLQPQVIRYAMDLVVEKIGEISGLSDGPIKEILTAKVGWSLAYFGFLTVLFALLMGVFMYFMRQTIIVMSRLIEHDLRSEIFAHYEKLHLAFYKKNNTGDLMARVTEDVSKVRMYIGPAVMYGINLIFLMVMVIYSMIQVNLELTLYSLIPLPVLSFSIYYVTSIINKRSEAIQRQLSVINSLAQEVYSGVRVVKSYVQEDAMGKYFAEEAEKFKDKSLRMVSVDAYFRPLMVILIGLSTIITVYVGGLLLIDSKISAGNIAEFIIYINMLTWPVTSIGWVASIIQQSAASQKRINEFLKTKPEILVDKSIPSVDIQGNIAFENVSFVYHDTGIQALKNINFKINKGEKLAIVGRTGSGKTTIADLLLRMYDVSDGEILIDGTNIKKLNLSSLRKQTGYVPQDVFLFSDSVANNIAFGAPETERQRIEDYAKYASVYNDIIALSEGFDTQIGERGVTLSGGQKQRISIARALIKEPQIIIMDDCLSAVDNKTEAEISLYLKQVCSDKTTIIITHRLNSNLNFDKILVLENGEMSAFGTHEELIADKQGYYYELYEKQRMEEV